MSWTVSQQAANTGTSTATATLGSAVPWGDIIFISVLNSTHQGIAVVTDGNGNTATKVNSHPQSVNASLAHYILVATPGQSQAFTATLSLQPLYISVYDVTHSAGFIAGTLNGTGVGDSGSTTATSTQVYAPSVTTTIADDIVFTTLGFRGGSPTSGSVAINTGSGGGATWNILEENAGGAADRLVDAYAIETGIGTFNPYWTWTTSRNTLQITTAIKPPPPQVGNTGGFFQMFAERTKDGLDVVRRRLILPDRRLVFA